MLLLLIICQTCCSVWHSSLNSCTSACYVRRSTVVSGGSGSSLEWFATSNKSRQLAAAVSMGDQSASLPVVVFWLTGVHCCISQATDSLALWCLCHFFISWCELPLQHHWHDVVTLISALLVIILAVLLLLIIMTIPCAAVQTTWLGASRSLQNSR